MSGTREQPIRITLEEYMEYQELKEHEKLVKITEVSEYIGRTNQGIDVEYKSDGAVWRQLSGKLGTAGARIADLVEENKRLRLYRQAGFWKRVLIKMAENKDD